MSENIRIRTTPNGNDNYLKVKVEQNFDFIEILSLKISQDKVYENFCSDYGVIVGRVTIGLGFGVENAKVSVFIPIDDIDQENQLIKNLYPFETVSDKDIEGIRYNLLPKDSDSKNDCYTPVGTFPSKREILDNEELSYVYCKYYKFTTTTNYAGDFMIFGVPLGQYVVHVDADVSDIGVASQRPYDLIADGSSEKLFYSPTKFKGGKNLNTLPQIKSANIGVNVQPFWGNPETCEIGITRLDIDLNYNIKPSAIFIGSVFGDSSKNSINKRCRPRRKLGQLCEQITKEGTIEMIRKTIDGDIERFDVDGTLLIDEDGVWAYQVPMNLDYVVTNEFGDIVLSEDTNRGIPTRASVRFRVSMDEFGGIGRNRTRGKYLVPNNPKTISKLDLTFDERTKDDSFRDLYWNKIYTVKSFIARFQRSSARKRNKTYLGIKDVDACSGDKTPMPYSRALTKINPIFSIICVIISVIAYVVAGLNAFLCWLRGVGFSAFGFSWRPFSNVKAIPLTCSAGDEEKTFFPGCNGEDPELYIKCQAAGLADALDMFQFDFYNEWVNGSLYFFLAKYKRRRKGRKKFCEADCSPFKDAVLRYGGTGNNRCVNSSLLDTTYDDQKSQIENSINSGVLAFFEDTLYYSPITFDGSNRLLYATDLVNLGAVFDCDWQNFPKIFTFLTDTSYELPPLVIEEPEPEDAPEDQVYTSGVIPLFFGIGCGGLSYDSRQAQNIRRQCELGVDVPEAPTAAPIYIGINEIYDPNDPNDVLFSPIRYVRDSFVLLNITGPSINTYPPPLPGLSLNLGDKTLGTSFNINGFAPVLSNNGLLYMAFRNFTGNNPLGFSGLDNSFYMYFGLIPGRTAIDKFRKKYYAECISLEKESFIIDTTVTNTSQNGGSNGSISITIVGGTPQFTITIVGISPTSYNYGPTTTNAGTLTTNIGNLRAGTYEITVTDSAGLTIVKQVTVSGPPALTCGFNVNKRPTRQTAADGEIKMIIEGGTAPYNVTGTLANGQQLILGPYSNSVNQIITNIPYGNNTFTVTDSSTPQGTCTTTTFVDAPTPITVTILKTTNTDCDGGNSGAIDISVSGGEPTYTVSATGPNNFSIPAGTSYAQALNLLVRLAPGVYTITASDTNGDTDTKTTTVYRILKPNISITDPSINNKRQCQSAFYTIKFKIDQCVTTTPYDLCGTAPYTLSYFVDSGGAVNTTTDYLGSPLRVGINEIRISQLITSTLDLKVKDSLCSSNNIRIPESSITRPTSLLSATYTQTPLTYNIVYTITGGQPPYTNTFSNPNDPFNYFAGAPRSYTTVIQDSVGCVFSLQVTVT